jgi:hypothetical protein
MKTSFVKPDSANPAVAVVENVTVPTPVEGVTVETTVTHAAPANPAPAAVPVTPPVVANKNKAVTRGGLILGDFIPEFKDIILPRLNIVQGVGKLKDIFPQGGLIFNQQIALFLPPSLDSRTGSQIPATPPVNIVVMGFRPTRYSEKVVGGASGMIVNTEDEVRAAGGTLDYKEWKLKEKDGMKRFEPLADALVAVERPAHVADDDTVFTYTKDGKKWALCLWGMKGTAYTHAAKKVFFTARSCGCLTAGYPTRMFAVSTRLEPIMNSPNKVWVPVCIPQGKTSEEMLAFVAGVINAPEAESAE